MSSETDRKARLKAARMEQPIKKYVEFPRAMYKDGEILIVQDADEQEQAEDEGWTTQAPEPRQPKQRPKLGNRPTRVRQYGDEEAAAAAVAAHAPPAADVAADESERAAVARARAEQPVAPRPTPGVKGKGPTKAAAKHK